MNKNKITKINANAVGADSVFARNSRGITLVALIITIIVMLILVGVSITIAINGGLFDVAKRAVKETEEAKNIESQLASGRVKIGETWYDSIEDYVNDKPSANQGEGGVEPPAKEPDTDTSDYDNAEKDANGLLLANVPYKTNGKTAIIPKGFKIIAGIEGTKNIADGLVIQDKDGNEFVWIPVEVTESDTETSIASFYRSAWTNNERTTLTNSNYIEPNMNGYAGEETEYNAMVKSVYKNKGFYIGRYEAGSVTERTNIANGTTEMVVQKDKYPYNYVGWGIAMDDYTSDIVYYEKNQGKGAVRLSKEMYQNKEVGVTSTLCYGIQWDTMLSFIKDEEHNVSNSISWGNYKLTDSAGILKNTGSSDTYSAKNIYDVAGNLTEWTMESYGQTKRMYVGSGYSSVNDESDPRRCRASYRNWDDTNVAFSAAGFRPALYIK